MVELSPQGLEHGNVFEVLNELPMPKLVGRARVRVQLPLLAARDSEPIPDVVLVSKSVSKDSHPPSALLAIEVSNSSVQYDVRVKAPLYAETFVPEYWVVDVTRQTVEVFSLPMLGIYTRSVVFTREATIAPSAFPDVEVPLKAPFPKKARRAR